MQYVEVRPNHFINATLVREFEYTLAAGAEGQANREAVAGEVAEEGKGNSLVVIFSNGDQRSFTGVEADALFTKLKGTWD